MARSAIARLPFATCAALLVLSGLPAYPAQAPAPQRTNGATAPGGRSDAAVSSRLVFTLPAEWAKEKPGSAMRLGQATIPGKDGNAQFAIYFFGPGGGGSASANLDRWRQQIIRPVAPPQNGSFTVGGLKVSWIEVAGTMKPSAIGMGPVELEPGWRLLGAVVEGTGGPWFFKITGPDATVASAHGAFLKMLQGLRVR